MATREWNPWKAGSPLLQDAARFPQMASTQLACRECSMQFSGPAPYMDHLKSARHQKKVAAHRLLAEIAAGGAPVNSSSPDVMTVATPSAARQPATQTAQMPFVCKLCDVAMNCEDAMIAHTKGKKHQKTLQREEVLRQFASIKGSPLPSAVTSPLPLAVTSPLPSAVTSPLPSAVTSPLPSAVTSPLPSAVTSPLPSAVTSSPPMTSPPPPMSPPTSIMSEPPQEKQEQNGEVIDLSCRVCGIVLFENVGYKLEHLETEAHRKKKMQVAGGQRLVTNALNPQ